MGDEIKARREQGEYVITLSSHDQNPERLSLEWPPPVPTAEPPQLDPDQRVSVVLSGYECCRCGVVSESRHRYCPNCDFFIEFQCWTCGWVSKVFVRACMSCGQTMLPPIAYEEEKFNTDEKNEEDKNEPFLRVDELVISTTTTTLPTLPALPHSSSSTTMLLNNNNTLTFSPPQFTRAASRVTSHAPPPVNRPRHLQPAPPPRPPLPKTMPDFSLLVMEYADEETELRTRALTEARVVEAANNQAEGSRAQVEEGTEVSLDLSHYSALDDMVEVLLVSPTFNISFRNIFLNTLHMFTSPPYLLDRTMKIMSANPPAQDLAAFQKWAAGRLKGFSVLNYWVRSYPQDFDGSMKDALFLWLNSIPCPSWGSVASSPFQTEFQEEMAKIKETSQHCLNEAKRAFAALAWMRKSVSTADHLLRFYTSLKSWGELKARLHQELSSAAPLNLLEKRPRETAAQLTLMHIERMLVIHGPRALLKSSLTKLEGAPSQMALSNAMSSWVASEVLRHTSRKMRAKIFKRMVKIAAECYALKNFATVFEIMYGLSQNSVYRLRGDKSKDQEGLFDRLTKRSRGIYDALIKFVSPVENFSGYRKVVSPLLHANTEGICWTPYIGVLLKDLVTIEEGGKPFKVKVHQPRGAPSGRRISLSSDPEGFEVPTVYVQFDKCRAVSRETCDTLACCTTYPVRDRSNPLYASWEQEEGPSESLPKQKSFVTERAKRPSKSELDYCAFVQDETMQLQLLDGILNAMTVDELDRRSYEILPKKPRDQNVK